MKRPKHGATLKQFAFAQKLMNAEGPSKKEMALSVGYSPSVANNTEHNIENTEGYKNAVIELANRSNNMVLAAMAEYEARGFDNFSNKDLNGAMNALAAAWDRINKHRAPVKEDPAGNPLRAIFVKRVETQTVSVPVGEAAASEETIKDAEIVENEIDDDDEL